MRALLIGRRFMAAYREAQGGQKKPSRLSEWFDWVRERTAPELQWMWSNHRAYKDEHTDAYAQVAGRPDPQGRGSGYLLRRLVQARVLRAVGLAVRG